MNNLETAMVLDYLKGNSKKDRTNSNVCPALIFFIFLVLVIHRILRYNMNSN